MSEQEIIEVGKALLPYFRDDLSAAELGTAAHDAVAALKRAAGDSIVISRAQYDALMAAAEAWRLIENLRAPEGHSITLLCNNPDFNGQPNCVIEVCAEWTNWEPKRFTGDTILIALIAADRAAGINLENEP